MISFYNKICPELLKVVSLNYEESKSNCIIFASNYKKLKSQFIANNQQFLEYPFINAFGVSLYNQQIINLAKTNIVEYISKQSKVFAQIDISKKILKVDNFYKKDIFGKDITVAVIDTGINPHLDFVMPKNRIIKFVDLINDKQYAYDDNGHGTFVSSIICGNGLISQRKFSGIAPRANIIAIKALGENGGTGAYKILEAMQWIYDNHKKYNIKVVCMSFGSSPLDQNDPLVAGAESLWNIGLVVVAAAGNSGPQNSTIKSPGVSNKIITVGGIDDKRQKDGTYSFDNFCVANFSSRGPVNPYFKPDIVAPAVNITGAEFKGFYTKMSGTSVATPMIAGACALLLNKYPNLSPDQVKSMLVRHCKKLSSDYNDDGFGLLDLSSISIG